jgi:hypothetical protein
MKNPPGAIGWGTAPDEAKLPATMRDGQRPDHRNWQRAAPTKGRRRSEEATRDRVNAGFVERRLASRRAFQAG